MTEQQNNTMFKFLRNGVEELISPEVWRWEAHYSDGTVLKQFADDGVFHQFAEIDQSKLAHFKMVSLQFAHSFVVPFSPDEMKLIHFYRNVGLGVGTPGFQKIRLYCFGYESKQADKKETHLLIITPNGESILAESADILKF